MNISPQHIRKPWSETIRVSLQRTWGWRKVRAICSRYNSACRQLCCRYPMLIIARFRRLAVILIFHSLANRGSIARKIGAILASCDPVPYLRVYRCPHFLSPIALWLQDHRCAVHKRRWQHLADLPYLRSLHPAARILSLAQLPSHEHHPTANTYAAVLARRLLCTFDL